MAAPGVSWFLIHLFHQVARSVPVLSPRIPWIMLRFTPNFRSRTSHRFAITVTSSPGSNCEIVLRRLKSSWRDGRCHKRSATFVMPSFARVSTVAAPTPCNTSGDACRSAASPGAAPATAMRRSQGRSCSFSRTPSSALGSARGYSLIARRSTSRPRSSSSSKSGGSVGSA